MFQARYTERQLVSIDGLVDAPEITSHLQDLACASNPKTCQELRFYVMRRPGLNASVLPNGATFIHTGLLLRVRSDAELATVINHEVAHYELRHHVHGFIAKRKTLSTVAIAASAARAARAAKAMTTTGAVSSQSSAFGWVEWLGAVSIRQLFAFDREQEKEADLQSAKRMYAAGFDSRHAVRFWQNTVNEYKSGGHDPRIPKATDTHPTGRQRMEYLSQIVAQLNEDERDSRGGSGRIVNLVAPYRQQWICDEMKSGYRAAQLDHILQGQKVLGAALPSWHDCTSVE